MASKLYNDPPLSKIVDILEKSHKGAVLSFTENPPDDDVIYIERSKIRAVCETLKTHKDLDFKMLTDETCIDLIAWPDWDPENDERFEIVYMLYSLTKNRRVRINVRVPEEEPVVDSVQPVWKAADWPEREITEMFGVQFAGHPNLKPLFLWEGFEGHPLRKDYPIKGHQPIVPLRHPIVVREEPAHLIPEFEKRFFVPIRTKEIDNEKRMPTSMLKPGWRDELIALYKERREASSKAEMPEQTEATQPESN